MFQNSLTGRPNLDEIHVLETRPCHVLTKKQTKNDR